MSELSPWQKWKQNLGETRPWDLINPETEYVEESIANSRLSICESCPELTKLTKQCKKCGCFMVLKTRMVKAECPLQKW